MRRRDFQALRHHLDDGRREHEPRTEGDEVFQVAPLPVALHDYSAAKSVGSGSSQAKEQADKDGIHAEREYTRASSNRDDCARGRSRLEQRHTAQTAVPHKSALFHFVLGGVAFARDDVVLQFLPLLVFQSQLAPVGRLQFDLYLAEAAVLLGVGRAVSEHVLVTDVGSDVGEDFLEVGSEQWEVGVAAGPLGERTKLVIALQVVHARDRAHGAVRIRHFADELSRSDAVDGDIARTLHLAVDLVEPQLAERVEAARDQDDVLVSLDAFQTIDGVVERVKEVVLVEAGDAERTERVIDLVLVLGEVHQDVRTHIVRGHRDPIVFLQRAGEGVRGAQRVDHEVVIGGSELHQQDGSYRDVVLHFEVLHLLRHAVFEDAEVLRLQVWDEHTLLRLYLYV